MKKRKKRTTPVYIGCEILYDPDCRPPCGPVARLYMRGYGKSKKGRRYISPYCMSVHDLTLETRVIFRDLEIAEERMEKAVEKERRIIKQSYEERLAKEQSTAEQ